MGFVPINLRRISIENLYRYLYKFSLTQGDIEWLLKSIRKAETRYILLLLKEFMSLVDFIKKIAICHTRPNLIYTRLYNRLPCSNEGLSTSSPASPTD